MQGHGIPVGAFDFLVLRNTFQVPSVVHVGIDRVQLDEALCRRSRRLGVALAIVAIGGIQLRLLRIGAVGIHGLEVLVFANGGAVVAAVFGLFGVAVHGCRGLMGVHQVFFVIV